MVHRHLRSLRPSQGVRKKWTIFIRMLRHDLSVFTVVKLVVGKIAGTLEWIKTGHQTALVARYHHKKYKVSFTEKNPWWSNKNYWHISPDLNLSPNTLNSDLQISIFQWSCAVKWEAHRKHFWAYWRTVSQGKATCAKVWVTGWTNHFFNFFNIMEHQFYLKEQLKNRGYPDLGIWQTIWTSYFKESNG